MVDKVWPCGPAAKSRMVSSGDLLLEVDGKDVTGQSVKAVQVHHPLSGTHCITLFDIAKNLLEFLLAIKLTSTATTSPDNIAFAGAHNRACGLDSHADSAAVRKEISAQGFGCA